MINITHLLYKMNNNSNHNNKINKWCKGKFNLSNNSK